MKDILFLHRVVLSVIMIIMVIYFKDNETVMVVSAIAYAVLMIITYFIEDLYRQLINIFKKNMYILSFLNYKCFDDTLSFTEYLDKIHNEIGE